LSDFWFPQRPEDQSRRIPNVNGTASSYHSALESNYMFTLICFLFLLIQPTYTMKDSILLDNGASFHMVNDIDKLEDIYKLDPPITVRTGNGTIFLEWAGTAYFRPLSEDVKFAFLASPEMVADIFTKPQTKIQFERYMAGLYGITQPCTSLFISIVHL
jgi:hypothetical protein